MAFGVVNARRPPGRTSARDGVEERTRRIEMLDHLAGDHELRGFESECRHLLQVATVDDVCVEPSRAGRVDALFVHVEADQRRRICRQMSVQPCARAGLHLPATGVGESDVDHASP